PPPPPTSPLFPYTTLFRSFPHFKWTRYPSMTPGGQAKVTLGGENLAISAYSLHKDEAFKAALCLRSPQMQDYSAVNDGVPPTVRSEEHTSELQSRGHLVCR